VSAAAKRWVKRHWPALRLRSILFATLFLVAALPGVGAVGLRVYENTLVRQTEAELVAQGAALAAAAAAGWPGAPPLDAPERLRPEPPRIDLNATPILPERPAPVVGGAPAPDPAAVAAEATMRPVFLRTRATTLASVRLLDRAGRLPSGPGGGASWAGLPEVRAALAGRPDTVIRRRGAYRAIYAFEWLSRAAAIRVHHARPVIVGGRVVGVLLLSRSARALFRGLYEDRGKIAVGIVAIFLVLLVLTALLSRGIARPIEALGRATRAVATGQGTVPDPPVTAAVEIRELYRDFAAMAAAIERRSRYLRDFAHAVSHEFKTPLAGIRGALELLADHGETMAAAERARFLANADADADRLAALVGRLLELARADMAAVETDARADVAAVAAGLAIPGLVVDADLPASLPPARIASATLSAVLTTLAENSRQAGATRVTIAAAVEGDRLVLVVADDGPGIAPGDVARVFEPFFTTRRATGGTGLGLPIAASLLRAWGGTMALAAAEGGASFAIALPAEDRD